jgi:hypothetical protein
VDREFFRDALIGVLVAAALVGLSVLAAIGSVKLPRF